jgi:ferredoxin
VLRVGQGVIFAGAGLGTLLVLCAGWFALASHREGEHRAARVFAAVALAAGLSLAVTSVIPGLAAGFVLSVVAVITGAVLLRCLLPPRRPREPGGKPTNRIDERDIMFARGRLRPDTPEFEAYYRMRPENLTGDNHTRSLPGLLSEDAEKAEPLAFAAAEACFGVCEALRDSVDGEIAPNRCPAEPDLWSARLTKLAVDWGAVDAGVAVLEPEHVYTHIGRGSGTWGAEIELDHGWAIAFTVEMDHAAVARAPEAPVVAESARQYVESARVAIQLASVIRDHGWPARAHIDGNYRVIAPLVARAARLGEIGRMGLLMTPKLGPRVRIGVVTTGMPLTADDPGDDLTVLDFCAICKKCATNCPVGAIPFGDRVEMDEGRRWVIDDETCYRYWNAIGTDCATCMKVCPYSHPDNLMHTLVRRAIRLSPGTRNLMLWADDLVDHRIHRRMGHGFHGLHGSIAPSH